MYSHSHLASVRRGSLHTPSPAEVGGVRLPVMVAVHKVDGCFDPGKGLVGQDHVVEGRQFVGHVAAQDHEFGRRAGDQDQLENKDEHARGGELSFAQRDLYGKDKGKKYEDLQDHPFTSCIGSRPEFFPI